MQLSVKNTNKRKYLKYALGGTAFFVLAGFYYFYNKKSSHSAEQGEEGEEETTTITMKRRDEKANDELRKIINDQYSTTARNFDEQDDYHLKTASLLAQSFGYTAQDLEEIGSGANLGLSCGNPVKQAKLKEGETVLDLGSGAGMDCFLARKYVGDSGRIIGVDMSVDMQNKAKQNAKKKKYDTSNMIWILSEIESMSQNIDAGSVDCIISNCVVNLVPNKFNAFQEMYKVLKPNGRICLSDIALKKELPPVIRDDIKCVVGCISGAILATEYEKLLKKAGFTHVQMLNKNVNLNVWKNALDLPLGSEEEAKNQPTDKSGGCCGPSKQNKSGGRCGSSSSSKQKTQSSSKSGGCCGASSLDQSRNNNSSNSGCCGSGSGSGSGASCCDPNMKNVLDGANLNDYIASYYVFATK